MLTLEGVHMCLLQRKDTEDNNWKFDVIRREEHYNIVVTLCKLKGSMKNIL